MSRRVPPTGTITSAITSAITSVITRMIASLVLVVSLLSNSAYAQDTRGGDIDLNTWRPAMDSRGYLTVNASQVLGHQELSFGLVSNYGKNVLTLKDGDKSYQVSNVVSATLLGAVGLKFGPAELEFGASVPLNIMSGDRGPDYSGLPAQPNDDEAFGFEGQGLGDIGLHVKTRFLSTSKGRRIGIAAIGSLYVPTATESNRWIGEGGVTPQIMGVLDKEFGEEGDVKIAVNGGFRLPTAGSKFNDTTPVIAEEDPACAANAMCESPTDISTGQSIESAPSIPFGAAIAYAISPQKFDVVGEVFGALPLGGENYFPLEATAGVKLYLARNSFLTIGGGVGFIPDKGANPDFRLFVGIIFEPNIGDRDHDRIKDDVDQCPDDPEDYDQFEDDDGCPEPDNDHDGILDEDDQCPNEPEDKDNFEDEDGCPEGNEFDRDGDGILDKDDQCPDDPEDIDEFEDQDGCPDLDNDQDGILDVDDLCPNDPEDKDDWEDEDGCPDPDNDKDRILDVDDQCPNEPETYNGVDDEDGCPDRGRVVVTDTNIEILDKIYFEYNKSIIKPQSYPILDAVAATLEGNPDILLIEIQGHTDKRGGDDYNLRLSDDRAASVRRYLIDKGVGETRLQSQGYGETQPLDNTANEEAYAKNRRVEFLILKRANE